MLVPKHERTDILIASQAKGRTSATRVDPEMRCVVDNKETRPMRTRILWTVVLLTLVPLLAAPSVVADSSTWRGEYYANQSLAGTPALVRNDPAVNFNWGAGSPAASIPSDHFSVRWTRSEHFSGGIYRFHVTTDDGVRLWVDSQLLIDQWHNQPATAYEATISLSAGTHCLRLEYYEDEGDAVIDCWWESVCWRMPDRRCWRKPWKQYRCKGWKKQCWRKPWKKQCCGVPARSPGGPPC